MAQVKYFRFAAGKVESQDVDEHVFGIRAPRRVQREAVIMYQANARAGTHDTLRRSEVNGSIKKPWKQKHTGRARAGRVTSPLWRGGGIIFGPHPRDYSYAIPRKALRAATRASLAGKLQAGAIAFVDALEMKAPRTKTVLQMLSSIGAGSTCLIVLPETDDMVWRSARNIPGTTVKAAAEVNAYDVLSHRTVVMTTRAFELLKERLASRWDEAESAPKAERAKKAAAAADGTAPAKRKAKAASRSEGSKS